MTLYVRRKYAVKASVNSNVSNPLFDQGGSEERFGPISTWDEVTTGKLVIAGSTTDEELPLGPGITTGTYLYIESDQDFQVKLNNTGNTGYDVKAPSTTVPARLVGDFEFSAVYISIPGADDATVLYAMIGA